MKKTGWLVSTTFLVCEFLVLTGYASPTLLLVGVPLGFIVFLIQLYTPSANPFQNIAFTVLGLICVTLPLTFFSALGFSPDEPEPYRPILPLSCFCLVWVLLTAVELVEDWFCSYPTGR